MKAIPDNGPGFWMHEQSGVLAPVVLAYLKGDALSSYEITIIRSYIRQWIDSPVWDENPHAEPGNPELQNLRTLAAQIETQADITHWLGVAEDQGIDPL